MSQIFELCLAIETLSTDAQLLGVTPAQLQHINARVRASIVQQPHPQLWLTYQIQLPYADLAAQLSWPAWERAQVSFTDYLWEQTCLECFIAGSSTDPTESTAYIEINASPNGRYALYQFESYRNPSSLPPTPLLQADRRSRTHISWSDNLTEPPLTQTVKLFPFNSLTTITTDLTTRAFRPRYCYQRSFGVPVEQLLPRLFNNFPNKRCANSLDNVSDLRNDNSLGNDNNSSSVAIEQLHPCVILRFGAVALYFAPTHASPPDFHQRCYWSRFYYQAALTE